MSETLLIHGQQKLVDLITLNLNVYVGTNVIHHHNFADSKALIQNNPEISLIICTDAVINGANAESFFKIDNTQKKTIHVIVLGKKTQNPNLHHVSILPEEADINLLIKTAAKHLEVTPKKMVEHIVPDFFPFKTHYCLSLKTTPCDIYTLSGEGEYTKEILSGNKINLEVVNQLISNGIGSVFVRAKDRIKFINEVTTNLLKDIKAPHLTIDEKLQISSNSFGIVQEAVTNETFFINASVLEITTRSIHLCLEIAKRNPAVAVMLKRILSSKSGYHYKHAQVIIYICDHIISNINWGTREQLEKLGFVAFFHDISLKDERLAKVSSTFQLASDATISADEKIAILGHAKTSADIVTKFSLVPFGVDSIIQQHHGVHGGQGFTSKFPNNLSPLAIIFIIAEDLTNLILEQESNENLADLKPIMLKILNEKYTHPQYTKIIEVLKTIKFS